MNTVQSEAIRTRWLNV